MDNSNTSPQTSPKKADNASNHDTVEPKTTMIHETKQATIHLSHEGTDCWALFHGGLDYFPATQVTEKYIPNQIQVVLPTTEGPYVAQSQKGYMSMGLGISDYSQLIEQQKEKCHGGTFTVDDKTFLMLIKKQYLEHFINITYQTCQKMYHKTPSRFYVRINSKSDAQDGSKDIITTETPEDTSRYVEIENFQQYLGTSSMEGTYKVQLYNYDKSQRLAQVTQY